MSSGPDYELWQALHAACPVEASCCVVLDFDDLPDEVIEAARIRGLSVDAFVQMAITEAVRGERG